MNNVLVCRDYLDCIFMLKVNYTCYFSYRGGSARGGESSETERIFTEPGSATQCGRHPALPHRDLGLQRQELRRS